VCPNGADAKRSSGRRVFEKRSLRCSSRWKAPLSAQQFAQARQSAARGILAGADAFFGAVERIPLDRVHVRLDHQIGEALPGPIVMLLRGVDGPRNHLKNILRRRAVPVVEAHVDSDDAAATHLRTG